MLEQVITAVLAALLSVAGGAYVTQAVITAELEGLENRLDRYEKQADQRMRKIEDQQNEIRRDFYQPRFGGESSTGSGQTGTN